ncbi:hypothetical protein Patl1_34514 [Pistacia atlantica]|uniref:Uncharacterized protein n=1 Tax=Pistacia atlantica TaxID=434234 RepID=A0ACC0ZXJ2_9ROSI|nr:hypothetical protein Patl1_34514 [Pistacia atlantica]
MGLFQYGGVFCFCLLLVFKTCIADSQHIGKIYPGFEASHSDWVDKNGLFLRSTNSVFACGFYTGLDGQLFLLVVIHISSAKVVWTANRGKLVKGSEKFVFGKNGNVYLQLGDGVAWSSNTTGQKVSSMELQDSGKLVLLGEGGTVVWQSYSHPTDTLLPGQEFSEGMRLKSFPNSNNMSVFLEIKSGDLVLYAGYKTPQTYWSLANDSRKTNSSIGGKVHSAYLESNAWNFYDQNKKLLWQFVFTENNNPNATWAVILGSDGAITFSDLHKGDQVVSEAIKIPQNSCGNPEPCNLYHVCYFENRCPCPLSLQSFNCKPPIASNCDGSNDSAELLFVGENLYYFALGFVKPLSRFNVEACKEACLHNCSCSALFFQNSTQSCYLFDQIGSFQRSQQGSAGYISYVKIVSGNKGKKTLLIVFMVIASIIVIAVLLYLGLWYRRKQSSMNFSQENLEEDIFLDSFSCMPTRFSYDDLSKATKSFSTKVGQGGYGMVLLEIIGGRKCFELENDTEKAHFPSYAFKMLEEGKVSEILDPRLNVNENDEQVFTAIKVALWCIQDEMHLRPPMTKVVQMLEGLCVVPQPPIPSQLNSRAYSGCFKWNDDVSSSGILGDSGGILMSAVRLSGPR